MGSNYSKIQGAVLILKTLLDLDACHRMKKKDKVIIKFKNRKQRNDVIFKRKELKSKGDDLLALQFGRSLFINDSMFSENQVLFYKCQ